MTLYERLHDAMDIKNKDLKNSKYGKIHVYEKKEPCFSALSP